MSTKNKTVSLIIAMVLAAFALPAMADNKSFTLTVPAAVSLGSSTQTVTLTNSANGNSTFNSFEIDVLTGTLSLSGPATAVIGGASFPASSISATKVVFTSVSPVKVGKSAVVTLTTTATSADCNSSSATWDAKAWTGSPSSPSSVFTLITPKPIVTTINPGCTLSFVAQPAGAQKDATITSVPSNPSGAPVKVALLKGGVTDTSFTGSISLAIKSGTGTAGAALTGGGAVSAVAGVATFPSLSIDTVGTNYVLRATTAGATSADSNAFTIFAGVLGCNPGPPPDNAAGDPLLDPAGDGPFVGTPGYGLRRGPNLNGDGCILVDFTFTFDPTNNTASLLYDKSTGQQAQFEYVLLWSAVPIGTSGWPGPRPQVSWGVDNPSFPADYVPALACLDDNYENLTVGAVMPTIPAAPPFNDGTYPAATYPQYQPGQPAKMCVAQEGWTSVGGGLVQHWTKVIDRSDGYVRLP